MRVVINYKKTQKTVVRVSPHSPLRELIPIISSKCEFDPSHTVLLKNYQCQEPLDMTKTLNDLGLRELYAMDVSQGKITSVNCCYITFLIMCILIMYTCCWVFYLGNYFLEI